MKINFDNSHLTSDFRDNSLSKLREFQSHLIGVRSRGDFNDGESSINLVHSNDLLERVRDLASEKGQGVRHVIVVGIGGSSLGSEAIYQALGGHYGERTIEMLFVETVDSKMLERVAGLFASAEYPHEVLVVVASKSGRTIETMANADIIYRTLVDRFGGVAKERVVTISDENSSLSELALREGFSQLTIPSLVGGRYSVFSAVGLFPLAVAGIDIVALVRGAKESLESSLHSEESPAFVSALVQAEHYLWGRKIHDTFIFDPSLETLGKWYRQLLGESIGKTDSVDGEERRVGITPTVSIGSTDLHSVGQLYFGGPKGERLTTFVRRENSSNFCFSDKGIFLDDSLNLKGKTVEDVMHAISLGVRESYKNSGLPFIDVWLEEVTEYELGAFMQWKMVEVMFLARLLDVNPFDQPAVEDYKNNTIRILREQ